MELGLQEDEAKILVEYSMLLHSSQGSLSLPLAFASHHEAHSFLPIQTNPTQHNQQELNLNVVSFILFFGYPCSSQEYME